MRSRTPRLLAAFAVGAALLSALALPAQGQDSASGGEPQIETDAQIFSYALGLRIGRNLQGQGIGEVDARALAAGVQDVLADAEFRVPIDELQAAVQAYQDQLESERAAVAERNKRASEEFLASNRGKDGVVELDSGLQYKVLREGQGERPSKEDSVVVHYQGRLVGGEEFDSSYARGEPASLNLARTIEGWQQALPMMKEGAKWRLFVPPELGYGAQGAGERIGPNQALIFDVELIEVEN